MTIFIQVLYISLGFLLSINQGVSIIVGHLRNGDILGSDIFMPVDIPLYLLLFLTADKSRQSQYWFLGFFVKLLLVVFYLLALTGEFVCYDYAEFRFQFVHLTRAMLIFLIIASRLHDKQFLPSLVIGLLAGLGFQSFIGFWQWQVGPIRLPYFKIASGYRVSGTMQVANAFGAYLITLVPLAIRIAFFTNLKPKLLWIIITGLSLGALFATYTRGAWLAFIGAMALFALFDLNTRKIKRQQKIIFVALSILFIIFMGVKYGNNISVRMSGASEALAGEEKHSRASLAKDAYRIINENKSFGVGLNNYRHFADNQTQGLRIVHNAYLLIAAEQGLIALALFAIANIIILVSGFKLLRSSDNLIYNVGSATLTSYTALLVYHMVAPDYRIVAILMQHYRLLGMIIGLLVMNDLASKKMITGAINRKIHYRRKVNGNGIPREQTGGNAAITTFSEQQKDLKMSNIRLQH